MDPRSTNGFEVKLQTIGLTTYLNSFLELIVCDTHALVLVELVEEVDQPQVVLLNVRDKLDHRVHSHLGFEGRLHPTMGHLDVGDLLLHFMEDFIEIFIYKNILKQKHSDKCLCCGSW